MVVAMSGGVDSSVAAALLSQQGYEVIGLTMRLFDLATEEGRTNGQGCCSPEDIYYARTVAANLGIPFYVLNFKAPFEREVVHYFVQSYLGGRTPNPCVVCNQRLKFELLMRRARELDASYLATGHYARIERLPGNSQYLLKKAADLSKDQSYFLFTMTQDQLAMTLFPLGELNKKEVRALASRLGLKVANKAESQEVCFIPDGNYADFIHARRDGQGLGSGDIVNGKGELLGRHQGIWNFTVGQRKGLKLTSKRPLYVLGLDAAHNSVIVGPEDELYCHGFTVSGLNWILLPEKEKGFKAQVKIRYRHEEAEAYIYELGEGKARVEFSSPQKAVTPGQAAVFYQDGIVLGGGWIEEVL